MRLVVVSNKPIWVSARSPTGYATDGGFPFQMAALSELFDQTTLVLARRRTSAPGGLKPLEGHHLTIHALPEPPGRDFRRKLAHLGWLPLHLPALWSELQRADAVHSVVPGDIGSLSIPLALALRKPLFVRHCGTWGKPTTVADRLLGWYLVRIAGGKNVVLATGGGDGPPERSNPAIGWIFSTTLKRAEIGTLPQGEPWRPGRPLRLASVGRLTRGKNATAAIRATAEIRRVHPETRLDVLGHGEELSALRELTASLGLAGAVTFHGNVAHRQVLACLCAAHLLLFPTRVAEGSPKSVLEAMASGCVVLAPRVSVVPQLLCNGRGVLLDATTPEAVAGAVKRILVDPDALAAMAEAARRHVTGFTLERWRDQIGASLEKAWRCPLSEHHL